MFWFSYTDKLLYKNVCNATKHWLKLWFSLKKSKENNKIDVSDNMYKALLACTQHSPAVNKPLNRSKQHKSQILFNKKSPLQDFMGKDFV